MFPRFNVLGVGVHAACMRQTLTFLMNAASERQSGYVCIAGIETVVKAHDDPALREILNQSLLTIANDCRVATVGRLAGHACLTPVESPDLMQQLCRRSAAHGLRHFLLSDGTVAPEAVKTRLQTTCPELQVVGTASVSGVPSAEEERSVLQQLRACRPDFIWINLPSIEQEQFMARCMSQLEHGVMIGVGSAFAGLAELKASLGRTASFRSLLRRHLLIPFRFTLLVLAQLAGLRHYDLPSRTQPLQSGYSLPRAA